MGREPIKDLKQKQTFSHIRGPHVKDALRPKLIKHLKIQTRIFKKQIADTHQDPTRKRVHQLRITTRRIRAALWLAEHGSPNLSFGKLSKELRKLGQVLGDVRELDVMTRDADKYKLKIRRLKKKCRAARKDLFKQTNSKHRNNMVARLNKANIKIQKHQKQIISPGMALLKKRILPWAQKTLATDDFHELRILTKRTRYILETAGRPAQPLRDLQDVLGKGHDLEVLQDFSKGNSQVRNDIQVQYRKSLPMIRPTLRFAAKQLSTVVM